MVLLKFGGKIDYKESVKGKTLPRDLLLKENGKVEVKQELKELSSSALPSLACSDISRPLPPGSSSAW